VNIAAVMAALDITDLDHYAKQAAVVVACRADRTTGTAEVSAARVAADMSVHPNTARKALRRAVDAGRISVEFRRGYPPRFDVRPLYTPTSSTVYPYTQEVRGTDTLGVAEGVFGELQKEGARPTSPRTAGAHNPQPTTEPPPVRRHPPHCWRCDGTGWVQTEDGRGVFAVAPCPGPSTNGTLEPRWPPHSAPADRPAVGAASVSPSPGASPPSGRSLAPDAGSPSPTGTPGTSITSSPEPRGAPTAPTISGPPTPDATGAPNLRASLALRGVGE
jgi:hypothetical protein